MGDGGRYGGRIILSDLIRGRTNPWAGVFDPARFEERPEYPEQVQKKLQSVGGTITVDASWFDREVAAVPPGEGKVIEVDGQKVAVYRDGRGTLHALDPTCMHMAAPSPGITRRNPNVSPWFPLDAYGRVIEPDSEGSCKEIEEIRWVFSPDRAPRRSAGPEFHRPWGR